MQKTFASDKFLGNMKIAVLSMVVTYVNSLLDYFLVGRVMGEEALQAFALLSPYLSVIFFASCLISSGTSIMLAFEVGKGSREKGNHYFSQGTILAVAIGLLLGLLLLLCREPILSGKGVSPRVTELMREYYIYICLLPIWHMVNELLFSVIGNAGGDLYCVISMGAKLAVNVIASVLLMEEIGIGGTGLGTVLANIVGIVVLLFYFRTEGNVFRWGWFLDFKAVRNMFHFGARDAMVYLYMALLQFGMNAFLLIRFGGEAILIFSILMNLENLYLTVFNAPSNAVSVLLTVFVGEGNRYGVLKSMRMAEITATIEGILTIFLLYLCAEWIPGFFGITNIPSMDAATTAIRLFALGALVYPYIMLYSTYYLAIQRVHLSIHMMTMQILIVPMLLGVVLSYPFGMNGVWFGLAMGSIVTFTADALILKFRHRDKTFPHLLDQDKIDKQLSYDVPITQDGVMSLVDQVEQDLKQRQVDVQKVHRIMLTIEETEMLVVERNIGRGGIIQCDIFFEDQIRLVLRDSGLYSDATDQDSKAESFRSYAAAMICGSFGNNQYVLTWGNNRTVYRF